MVEVVWRVFWDAARFGVQDFNEVAGVAVPNPPAGSVCIPASPKESFLTAIENSVPIDATTPLVDGVYDAIDYYENQADACDPFDSVKSCLKSFILMISGGTGADLNNDINKVQNDPSCIIPPFPYYTLSENTCYGNVNDLRALAGTQNVETFIVNPMGINGAILEQAAEEGGGNYYFASNAALLRAQLIQAFQDILKRAASGTAASVLASGEGSGANIIQAIFYPVTPELQVGGIFDRKIAWIGRLTNFWYYIDPFFANSSIREETDGLEGDGSYILDLENDYIINFYFDAVNELTKASRCSDDDGDGDCDTPQSDVNLENVLNLWEAGKLLWERDISAGADPIPPHYLNHHS
ncbi:MAG: hypothetical protein L0956_10120, partial [Candidatus Mariimomonas ferrooxydans]